MPVRFFQRLMSILIAVTVFAGAQEPVKPNSQIVPNRPSNALTLR
jgi:hypothetical protein